MVTIIGVETRKNSLGESFNALILQGGVELVKSKETGKFYATARKTSIPSTFDDNVARSLIGNQLPGQIIKVEADPYDFTTEDGEVITLSHTYEYTTEAETMEEAVMA